MAEKTPQTFATHVRFDPLYHYFALPVFGISVIGAIVRFILHPGLHTGWLFVVSVAAVIAVFKLRTYSLKNQDRIIRLEERLRLATLLSDPLRGRILELSETQLIGLRFAGDAEVPGLVERALGEKLSREDIKKSVKIWRPDYWRV